MRTVWQKPLARSVHDAQLQTVWKTSSVRSRHSSVRPCDGATCEPATVHSSASWDVLFNMQLSPTRMCRRPRHPSTTLTCLLRPSANPCPQVAGGWSHNRTAFSFKDDNAGFRLSVDARRHLDCTQHVHLSLLLLRLGLAGPSKCKSIGRENLRREGTNQDVRYPLIVLPMRCSRPASPASYSAPPRALSWAVLDLTTNNMPAAAVVGANLFDLILETFWCRAKASRDTAAVMGENPKAESIASAKISLTSAKSHPPLVSASESTDILVCSPHASTAKLPQGSGGSCRRMRVHRGAVDRTMLTIGSPSEVMEHV